jgi:hypothetical protein
LFYSLDNWGLIAFSKETAMIKKNMNNEGFSQVVIVQNRKQQNLHISGQIEKEGFEANHCNF